MTGPRVLYLDELSMGLAPLIVAELYELVARLSRQGMTIVLVEQFVTTALAVADHAAIMVHGRIEQQGSPNEMADAALERVLGLRGDRDGQARLAGFSRRPAPPRPTTSSPTRVTAVHPQTSRKSPSPAFTPPAGPGCPSR